MQPVGGRVVLGGVLLGEKQNLLLVIHHLLEGAHRFLAPTNSGTIMWGKTTMSRRGRTGADAELLTSSFCWRRPPCHAPAGQPAGL